MQNELAGVVTFSFVVQPSKTFVATRLDHVDCGTTAVNIVNVLNKFFELFGMDNEVGFNGSGLYKTVRVRGQGRVWNIVVLEAERHSDGNA